LSRRQPHSRLRVRGRAGARRAQTERVQRVMTPLLRAMDNPRRLNEVRVAGDRRSNINAANAGGGEFQITTGLLAKANDDQLRGCWHTRLPTMILAMSPEHRLWVRGSHRRDSARTAFRQQRSNRSRGRSLPIATVAQRSSQRIVTGARSCVGLVIPSGLIDTRHGERN